MKKIDTAIITVTNVKGEFYQDMEVALSVPVREILPELIETLNICYPELYLDSLRMKIMDRKTGRDVDSDKSFLEAGIKNGDYLILV